MTAWQNVRPLRRPICAWLAAAVMLAVVRSAAADEHNRNLLPLGDREAFLGNAGITSASGGSVYYNPAGLARLSHSTLSVSGTTLLHFDLHTDAFLVVGGTNEPFSASGFEPIPATLTSTYKLGKWTAATSVLVPDTLALKNRTPIAAQGAKGDLVLSDQNSQLWLGASIARRVSDRVYAGVTVFGIRRSESSFTYFDLAAPMAAGGDFAASTYTSDSSLLGASAVGGIYAQLTARLGVGARIQSPLIGLTGSTSFYSANTANQGGMVTQSENAGTQSYFAPMPADAGVGVSYRATPAVELMVDVNLQLPTSYRPSAGAQTVDLRAAPRLDAGAEFTLSPALKLRLGAIYNASATAKLAGAGDNRETYLGATAGIDWKNGRTSTGLGGFLLHGSGELVPIGAATGQTASETTRVLGVLLTVTYNL